MNILVVVEDIRINKTSAGICNSNIIKVLLDNNHNLHCLYDYAEGVNFPWLQFSPNITMETLTVKSIASWKLNLFKIPKIQAISSYLTGFSFLTWHKINAWKKNIQKIVDTQNSYDCILVLGAGNSMLNFFAMPKIKTQIPYVVNYHDPYPMHLYPIPYKKKRSWVSKLQQKQSNKVMEKAFYVSFPSQRLQEWMLQYHPILKDKSIVLPHPHGNLQNLQNLPIDKEILLNREKFTILHTGSLLGPRNPIFLFEAFEKFIGNDLQKKKLAQLVIIGSVLKDNNLSKITTKTNQNESIRVIRDRISYKHSVELLQSASVLLLLEAVAKDSPFMPGKLTDYINANKPIIALTSKISETARLLGDAYPFITETDNVLEIQQIIETLWSEWLVGNLNKEHHEKLQEYVSSMQWNYKFNTLFKNV